MQYSNVVFAGNILVWLMNGLASVIRGTGNMLFPSLVICIGVTLLIPLSPLFIFGLGPMPALGIAGGGVAVVTTTALMAAILAWYILRPFDRPLPGGAPQVGLLRRHPPRRRCWLAQHPADDLDRGAHHRPCRRRGGP